MILFCGVFLLFLPTESITEKTFRSHFADNLKLQCYALPYRTIYEGNRCYFAIFRKIIYSNAHIACFESMNGAQVATKVPDAVISAMMVDKATFHSDTESSDAKYTICVRDSVFKCDKDQTLIRGKCISQADKKMNYADAQKNCKKAGMELFSPNNDFDNQIILRELVKSTAWIQKSLVRRGNKFVWSKEMSYSRFGTCDGKSKNPSLYAGPQPRCNAPLAAVIDKTGYWSNADQNNVLDVICTKDAGNELTPIVVKKVIIAKDEPCKAQHEMDEVTGKCEWTGPADACAVLLNKWNHTYYVTMPEFPTYPHVEIDVTGKEIDDQATKVVVRKGCMFTGYAFKMDGNQYQEIKVGENLVYGVHSLPNYANKDRDAYWDGLTRATCWCDAAETTVNGHDPAHPPDQKCIEHHKFNETTQQCEWVHEPKFCAEIVTIDNRRMRLEMPGWPEKKKYDVNHIATQYANNFHITVTNIIVRQHCVATLYWRYFHEWRTLQTSGYGYYDVVSYPKTAKHPQTGTCRFVCECIK